MRYNPHDASADERTYGTVREASPIPGDPRSIRPQTGSAEFTALTPGNDTPGYRRGLFMLDRLRDRLPLKITIRPMSNYMNRGEEPEPTDPYEESPFEPYHKIRHWGNKSELIQYAENSYRALEREGAMSDDDLRRAAIDAKRQTLKEGLWRVTAPLVATASDVNWIGAFRIDPEAPDHSSDEWREAASELDIPDTRSYDGVPKAVSGSYRHLQEVARKNDGPRPCHRLELKSNAGIYLPEERWRHVWDYLRELPGVTPPKGDKPAWEHAASDTGDSAESAAGQEGENHA